MAKEKLSKRQSLCKIYADKFYKTNMTYEQIFKDLLKFWEIPYNEGYQDHILDSRKLRDSKEALLLRGFNMIRDAIDTKIHEISK